MKVEPDASGSALRWTTSSGPATDNSSPEEVTVTGTEQPDEGGSNESHKVACQACRGLKMKCKRTEGQDACDRCIRVGRTCVIPPYRKPGRVRGAKNKYKGVDRALRQIQTELKRTTGVQPTPQEVLNLIASSDGTEADKSLLSSLLEAQRTPQEGSAGVMERVPRASTSATSPSSYYHPRPSQGLSPGSAIVNSSDLNLLLLNAFDQSRPLLPSTSLHPPSSYPDSFSLPPISSSNTSSHTAHFTPSDTSGQTQESPAHIAEMSNPLGLLAEASEALRPSSPPEDPDSSSSSLIDAHLSSKITEMIASGPLDTRLRNLELSWDTISQGLLAVTGSESTAERSKTLDFFKPNSAGFVRGDVGADFDPLELGLITEEEVRAAFQIFFEQLHPLISVLDPVLHTPEFVRTRSAFLFTVICFHGCQFEPDKGQLSKRLRVHADRVAKEVVARRYRSLEIAQAILVWLPWLQAPQRQDEDPSWFYTSYALTISVELGLDRPLDANWSSEKLRSALGQDLDGLDATDSLVVERMIRNRERFWLRFFLYESSASISFGRSSKIIAENELIRNDNWHVHPLADEHDKVTTAVTRLRRIILALAKDIQQRLEANPREGTEWIQPLVDSAFGNWRTQWPAVSSLSDGEAGIPSLYVDLLFCHARLWCLSLGLQRREPNPTGDSNGVPATPPAIVNDCLVAALAACKTAVEGLQSSRFFWKMPNTIYPLLSWAACLSMRLFDCNVGFEGFISSQAALLGLLGNLAMRLEEVGTKPSHRLGSAAIYGRHLQAIVRSRITAVWKLHANDSGNHASVTIRPGTVTPFEPDGPIPLSAWSGDWWQLQDNPSDITNLSMLGLLEEVDLADYSFLQ